MSKIILSTTASFSDTVEATDLKNILAKKDVEAVLHDTFTPPFPFEAKDVFAIVAGHTKKGVMLHVGPAEASCFPNIKVVTPFGVGTNHIDISGLEQAGIVVKKLPHFSKRTVAELALACMFALARRLVPLTVAMRAKEWKRQDGANIAGKTLGIIGLGSIGKEVAKVARGVGMNVIAYDIAYDDAFLKEWNVTKADLNTVLASSDFLTLHASFTPELKHLIGRIELARMKRGAFLINLARGEIVDEGALLEALESGALAGAGLDVFSEEPPFKNDMLTRLIQHPNVIATPHVGAFTPETRYAIAEYVCDQIVPYA